jgi:DNA-binding NtrC family response regulator
MQFSTVLVLQSDTRVSQSLVSSLCDSFFSVRAVSSLEELFAGIVKHRADIVILDMEIASLSDVQRLSRDYRGVSVVCTHRLADEEMWTSALSAGATDVCPPTDVKVLLSALRSVTSTSHAAA